jgi:hypothetical protein
MREEADDRAPDTRINLALGKILRYFNLLELNLGLCIRWLEHPGEVELSHAWLAKSSVQEKVERFCRLVRERDLLEDQSELDAWYQAARDIRELRNFYAHGTWEYLPLCKDAPVGFRIPPWRSESIQGNASPRMTLESLQADAEATQAVFEQFLRLRTICEV